MNILLSIKPKYAESILSGKKRYEFRKVIFKRNYIDIAYMYCSAPVKKIIGAFRVGAVIEDRPERLWEQLNEFSGLEEMEFFDYFRNAKKGYAIEIKRMVKFEEPLDPAKLLPGFIPPQSFYYVDFYFPPEGFQEKGKNKTLNDY